MDAAGVHDLREAVVAFAGRAGASETALHGVRLAVSEVLTNVVVHAYADTGAGPVTIDVRLRDGDLIVVVCDDGEGMRPRPDSPGLGLGLPMIARVAKDVRVTDRDTGGTRVALRFWLRS